MTLRRSLRIEAAAVVLLTLCSVASVWLLPRAPRAGLTASLWTNADGHGDPVVAVPGTSPTPDALRRLLRDNRAASAPVSVVWVGFLTVDTPGTQRVVVRSTGPASIVINNQRVAQLEASGGDSTAEGVVDLARGAYAIRVTFSSRSPNHDISVLWAHGGRRPVPLDAAVTSVSRPSAAWIRHGQVVRLASVAIPALWALLLLYVPVRLLATWMWRQVVATEPRRQARTILVLALVLAAGLSVWGIDWGIAGDEWAPDELRPTLVRSAMAERFSTGWHDKYPAMHYMVLSVPLWAFEIAARIPRFAPEGMLSFVMQFVLVRVLSSLLGLGALLALYLCAVEMLGHARAVVPVLVLTLTPLFLFYAKLANLDVPMLCWLGWALLGVIRILRRGDTRDYVLLGVAAAAAVATKDQAYASLALLPLPVFVATLRRQPGGRPAARLARALLDRRLLAGLGATAVASVVLHDIIFNPSGFAAHIRLLSEFNDIAIVPRTAAGATELTWRSLDLFRFSMGWPFVLLAVAGIIRAGLHPDRRWWLWLLLVPLSFHATFTCVTFFVCDRYLFAGVFVLALFAGSALSDLTGLVRRPASALLLTTLVFGTSLTYAASINVMMDLDARRFVRDWVIDRAPVDATVGMVGRYMPYLPPPYRPVDVASPATLAASRASLVVVNARYAARYDAMRTTDGRDLMAGLRSRGLGYTEVLRYRATPPAWAWLQYDPALAPGREAWWTNLDKVNPDMRVYARHRAP